ncbi:ABC transporter permease [Conexibacter sp. JD483]|uniref:ABC transporter permease n=1 Tax=unclassified Conexibacter TaxID=2627773 RepID=UPI002723FDE7|nr:MULTISPECIES: ABC transporter permease [unclassified Conexibacter]MDO8187656.1 ABC transporter permease [Conexibacter sp. CPCC 205706]MDO8199841.1 ABC transporter permease [Conexibacter sp. CPCC 205762]MDR9370218.1 ABC transporter permease [Conexibacter sp. JD483]
MGYPLATIVERSVSDFPGGHGALLDNYRWFFDEELNRVVLLRTFRTAAIVTLACLVIAYPYAYAMTVVGWRMRLVMQAAVIAPLLVGTMTRNYSWVILLQDKGPVNDALGAVGLGPFHMIGSLSGVIIGLVQISLPFIILPLYASLREIDVRLMGAARSLGATPTQAFTRVYLPLSLPGVVAGSLVVFVITLGSYITPALLGSPQQSLLPQLVAQQINQLLAWGRGSAMGLILLGVTLLLLWLGSRASRWSSVLSNGSGGGR